MNKPSDIFSFMKSIWYENYRKNLSTKNKRNIINECFQDAEYETIRNIHYSSIHMDNAQKKLYFHSQFRFELHNQIIERLYPIK